VVIGRYQSSAASAGAPARRRERPARQPRALRGNDDPPSRSQRRDAGEYSTESGPVKVGERSSVNHDGSNARARAPDPTHSARDRPEVGHDNPRCCPRARAPSGPGVNAATPCAAPRARVSKSPTSGRCNSPRDETARSTVALPLIPIGAVVLNARRSGRRRPASSTSAI